MSLKNLFQLDLPTLGRATLVGMALVATGCPGDDTGADTNATTDVGTTTTTDPGTTTMTIDPDSGSGTTLSPGTSSGTDTGPATGTDTGPDTDTDSDTDTDTEGGTTTGGVELCELMLPPPGMCTDPGAGFPGGASLDCDPIAQTGCEVGEKCIAWANDGGGSWNATRCSTIAEVPNQVGDPCTVESSGVSGIEDCDVGLMCWDVDPMTNMGTCLELCGCSYDSPTCQTPNTVCSISNNDALTICNPVCNPLDPDACPLGPGCFPFGGFFQCVPDASGDQGAAGDPCEFINACDPGNICLAAASVPGCAGGVGCCASACSTEDPAPGCPAGAECLPWYEEGAAPDECLGTAGVCAIAP